METAAQRAVGFNMCGVLFAIMIGRDRDTGVDPRTLCYGLCGIAVLPAIAWAGTLFLAPDVENAATPS